MYVPAARLAIADDTPVMAIKSVAKPTDFTAGANIIEMEKTSVPKVHVLSRLGFDMFVKMAMIPLRLSGGRGVNPGFSASPGLVTSQGKTIAVMKVVTE